MHGDLDVPALRAPGRVDVLVLGAGAAGLACAIALASRGRRALVLSRRRQPPFRIGESLAPPVRSPLEELGVWEGFLADDPLACHANVSAWGSEELHWESFVSTPWGNGWQVDRRRFEELLARRAAELGVPRLEVGEAPGITRERGAQGWRLEVAGAKFAARYLVDATGRASWLARRLGVRRQREDRQIALVALLAARREPAEAGITLVEAVRGGWWYAAVLPGGQLAALYFTDPDLVDRTSPGPTVFFDLVARTRHVRAWILRHGERLLASPGFVAADGTRLERASGDGWLAVGDAAMSYDPLSGHGTTAALAAGRDAAAAIAESLDGRRDAIREYEETLREAYGEYRLRRQSIYRAESRWPCAPFWARRQSQGAGAEL